MSIKHIINSNTESIYVTDTYNTIANEFSHTRFSVWSNVAKFINSFPTKAICLEVDAVMAKICYYGMISHFTVVMSLKNSLKSAKINNSTLSLANNLSLPYQNNSYDYVLSIAVIHHFASYQHRKQAIKELIRVTKHSGEIFIEVWAFRTRKRRY